jgi:signal transduction histidine kinase
MKQFGKISFALTLTFIFILARAQDRAAISQGSPQVKDSLRYVDSLNRLAAKYYVRSLDTCMKYARQAFDISDRLSYAKGKAGALNNMGIVYNISNNPSLSFRYYSDALKIYQDLGDSANMVKLLMNIGLTLNDKGEYAKSQKYLWNAIYRGGSLRNDSVVALLLVNYVTVFLDSIPKDSIPLYLEKASLIANHYHDERVILLVEQTQGRLDLEQGRREAGLDLLRKSATDGLAFGENFGAVGALFGLGDAFLPTNLDSALKYYNQGLVISREKGYQGYTKWTSLKLYNYYYAKGDLRHAEAYADQLLKIYEDQETSANISGVNYLDYAIAREQLETIKARSENRKLTILILSIVFVFTLAIAVFLFQLYRLRDKHALTLEALNKAVGERNEQLQQKNEFNNKLVSLLAHDFRQPIITAKNLATLLKDPDDFTKEELQQIIQSIEVSSDTAIEIFENILQWIKRQLSGFSYEPVVLHLKDLTDQALRPFIGLGEGQRISFVNAVSPGFTISADKELVQFINRNLIHNALKFSPEGSTITVSAEVRPGEVVVCVRDEGKGINPEKLPQLFNFKKELQYDNDKEKGAGVALMICKDFIDRMHGRIWAENGPVKGAVFCYALPNRA